MMPEMSGYDLCKEIKSNKKLKYIPIILLTAMAEREMKLENLICEVPVLSQDLPLQVPWRFHEEPLLPDRMFRHHLP